MKEIFKSIGEKADRINDGESNPNYISDHSERKRLNRLTKLLSKPKIYIPMYLFFSVLILAAVYYLIYKMYQVDIKGYFDGYEALKNVKYSDYAEKHTLFSKKVSLKAPLKLWYMFIILLAVLMAYFIKLSYHIKISYSDLNVGQKGTSRWTTRKEIYEQYKKIPQANDTFEGYGGVPVARESDNIYIDDTNTNAMIIGTTRSGKDEVINNPLIDNISRAKLQSSFIATDPKLEYAHKHIPTLNERGYNSYILNFIDPEYSCGYNPLKIIIDEFEKGYESRNLSVAQDLAMSTSYVLFPPIPNDHNPFFTNTSRDLFVATLFAMCEDAYREDEENNIRLKAQHTIREKQRIEKHLKEHYGEKYNDYLIKLLALKIMPDVYLDLENHKDCLNELITEIRDMAREENIKVRTNNLTEKKLKRILLELKINHGKIEKKEFISRNYAKDKINIYSLVTFVSKLSSKGILNDYFLSREETSFARLKYSSIMSSQDKTTGDIVASFFEKTSAFLSHDLAKITSFSSIDIKDIGFGEKPVAIYVGLPDQDSSKDFLATLFITQVNFVLSRLATATQEGKLRRRTYFILNEFVSLPKFENIAKNVRVGLGREILHVFTIQDIASLHNLYQEDATSILSNCGNLIFLKAGDNDTNKEISEAIGDETYTNINRTGKKLDLNKEISEVVDGRSLITANQLKELKMGEMVVIRTMKRTDNKGNAILSTPIANLGKNRMRYRYEFLEDTFPSKQKIYKSPRADDIGEDIVIDNPVDIDTTYDIDLESRIFNTKRAIARMYLDNYPIEIEKLELQINLKIQTAIKISAIKESAEFEVKVSTDDGEETKKMYSRRVLYDIAYDLMNSQRIYKISQGLELFQFLANYKENQKNS